LDDVIQPLIYFVRQADKLGVRYVLVVGHSNTVLPMLVITGVKPEKNKIPD